jgi:hypothetical protein
MNSGGTRGAGILHAGRPLEAQIRRRLQNQRGREVLCGKAGIEVAQHDLVDVGGRDACVCKSIGRYPHNQAFDGLSGEFSKGRMGPADDACGH